MSGAEYSLHGYTEVEETGMSRSFLHAFGRLHDTTPKEGEMDPGIPNDIMGLFHSLLNQLPNWQRLSNPKLYLSRH